MKAYGYLVIFLAILTLVYGRRVHNPCEIHKKIPCDNGDCVRSTNWCDDYSDCSDRSDEKYCKRSAFDTPPDNNCTTNHFVCADGMCFPASVKCDGNFDCFDSSDERNCDKIDQEEFTRFHGRQPETPESRIGTSYNNNKPDDYSFPTLPSPPSVDYDTDYNRGHSGQKTDYRNPNTHPERQYPGNQQPNTPLHTPESTSRMRPHVQPTSQTRPDYPLINRQLPMVYPPRTIVSPPRIMSPSSARRTVRRPNYPNFYFAKNYTEDLLYDYERNVKNAKDWLLDQRDDSYRWGKGGRDTPRALIALSLLSNSFKSDVDGNELMRKGFESYLGLKLLRNETGRENVSTTKLAVYINTLLATCQNPHNFFGIDLVHILFQRQSYLEHHQHFVNPLVFLTLCLTNQNVPIYNLQPFLRNSFPTEPSKDLHILATTAMACIAQQNPHDRHIKGKLEEAIENLLSQMNTYNGTFGSKYTTALAAQALMSVNTSQTWNYKKTLDYLAREQLQDGSFGDMQSTYYSMLALNGRSLLHLRNTECDPVGDDKKEWSPEDILNKEGPRKNIVYTLKVDYPETFSTGLQLSVPIDTNLYEIMRIAAYMDSRYKFNYEYSKNELGIHSIANIPNDPERGMFWTLYVLPSSYRNFDFRSRYTANLDFLVPQDGDEILFWYLSDFLSY